MPLCAETSGWISAQHWHGDGRGAAATPPCLQRRAGPAAMAAPSWLRCHWWPRSSRTRLGCAHGMPGPRQRRVPACSGQGAILRWPLQARQLRSPRAPGRSLSTGWHRSPDPRLHDGLCVRLQHRAPLLRSSRAGHTVTEPLAGCQPGLGVPGRSGPDPSAGDGMGLSWADARRPRWLRLQRHREKSCCRRRAGRGG